MGFVASVCQPSTLRMLICPEASSAQNNIAAVSADGSTVWVLIRRLNSSCNRSIAFVVRTLRHWLGGSRVKANKRSPASSRLSTTARCLRRHRHSIPDGCNRLIEPRRTVDDEELGPLQPTPDEIVENRAPGLGTFATHTLDRKQHL